MCCVYCIVCHTQQATFNASMHCTHPCVCMSQRTLHFARNRCAVIVWKYFFFDLAIKIHSFGSTNQRGFVRVFPRCCFFFVVFIQFNRENWDRGYWWWKQKSSAMKWSSIADSWYERIRFAGMLKFHRLFNFGNEHDTRNQIQCSATQNSSTRMRCCGINERDK